MTSPFPAPSILPSALKKYAARDIRRAISLPTGIRVNFPREGILAVGGFSAGGSPMVVLIDLDTNQVFHAQRFESKYSSLFPR